MKLTQQKAVTILGIWLIILPFTGFPKSWKFIMTAVIGLVIAYLGALLWKNAHNRLTHTEMKTGTFTEIL